MNLAIALLVGAAVFGELQLAAREDARTDVVVRSILHDTSGDSWFGTWRNGVYRITGDDVTQLTGQDGLEHNQIRTVLEDTSGQIWLEAGAGVSRVVGGTAALFADRDYSTKHAWRLGPDDLWFKGERETGYTDREGVPGVYRFDGTTMRYHAFPIDIERRRHDSYSVTGIDQHTPGRVWIATYSAVIGYDGERFTIIDDETLGHTEDTGFLHARCVFEDSTGRLWIGNNGIGVILRDGDTTINFTQAHGVGRRDRRSGSRRTAPLRGDAADGTPSMHRVFSIGEDRDGNIWFGTIEQGAWRFDGTTLRQFTERDGLGTKQVLAITTDQDGVVWLGGEGVFAFDGEVFERRF